MAAKNKQTIYYSVLVYQEWSLYIATTAKGLCYVGSQNKPFEELSHWVNRRFTNGELVHDDEKLEKYVAELVEYFQGTRKSFSIDFDFYGTPFQLAVWNALCEIPFGQTQSYSDIAYYIQKPNSIRAVGTAIGANPVLIAVPCHRVIGKNGSLTGYRGGLEMKTKLLQLENENSLTEGSKQYA
ncbi:methylated-DNA--[protein]-cysteine S-methyltransferase [Brevibacillus laterosporus]|uniref:methylated-DNA--[protein]-cysteine S-methyltransferase n=1 Tax=Brevibacillus laterosporus TaxID=1465 RepID=UPI00036361F9|nr:methylated-DNA--[protein]-cysteine S-methyltransferase [Brevibacillus laterosporus]ATO51447.1 cysteine methyltransferase [Brevibacillus laterosporus DSM 25]MBG9775923.1 cysteine methyltransferase [Brevibacillus laterosporus]MBG9797761.1 cysteine methyltransferase [Brevibacillus laterosporus]MBG9801265.1 cysteine methyltransferase [Brevibacillus laterosporus]MCR8939622.1 methylated-DNA--[protein]-cysteine S-methyltransferase [Brevibacillus laterosporus]